MMQLVGYQVYTYSLASGAIVAGGLVGGTYLLSGLKGMNNKEKLYLALLGLGLGSIGAAVTMCAVKWNSTLDLPLIPFSGAPQPPPNKNARAGRPN